MNKTTTPRKSGSFTGRRYSRKPRRSVLWVDAFATRMIALSGIGSIVAVSLVGLFLVWVVLPLFLPTHLVKSLGLPMTKSSGQDGEVLDIPVASAIDNYGLMVWEMRTDGELLVRALGSGEVLDRIAVGGTSVPSAWAFGVDTGPVAFGYEDGRAQTGEMAWETRFLGGDEVPPAALTLAAGETLVWENGLLVRTPEGQLRHQRLSLELAEAVRLGETSVQLLDLAVTPSGLVLAAVDRAGVFHHRRLTMKTNMLTGKVRVRARGGEIALAELGVLTTPAFSFLGLDETGDLALLVRPDGTAVRLKGKDNAFSVSGRQDLVPDPQAQLTAVTYLNGRTSLLVGDSQGGVVVWFPARDGQGDEAVLRAGHVLKPGPAEVTALTASARSRMLAAGYADGTVRVFNATNERLLGENKLDGNVIDRLTIAPREDLLLVTGARDAGLWTIDAPYGEFSVGSLVRPVWYEGYPAPTYVWQSSSASDSFEPKLSLVPLIFGTLKATFYSLLFGLPLALLAAIFTSEFLPRATRAKVKPVIEIMASLPSVVLGFLAALVVAPWVEHVVVEVLSVLLIAPFFVLVGAHLWQMLPREAATRLENWRPVAVLISLALGGLIAWQMAPGLTDLAFAGDFKAWLDGRVGSGLSGWFVLLIVPASLLIGWANVRHGEGLIRSRGSQWGPLALAVLDLGRFLAASATAAGLALFVGWLLNASGWDPRGSIFDTYVQRNALVVGIAMGFAVIPLIYTISEDALVSVPDHLRAASLGAGATTWQTAIRVVVPPAMSGLFSAAMIGLGRAVGETMIVLMAAGNTPIMDMNIFNGFRTLSANLAVELPEAVQNSTHYRTLFLAALTLFVMTFVLNTVAEAVRLHFRRKTSRL
ncbi:MAG: ABC transporter permease subunit [Candidatus Krumholzibacteria bacterium]|nr:ABC transporter permease subunit [Candidatus Krumholzibacteria bacterium]